MEIVKEVMNTSDANPSNKTIPVITESTKTLLTLLYSLITVVAIGGNGIVCYLVFAYKRMRTVPNYFIVNLAISDMLTAVFCIPFTFVANLLLQHWPFGTLMCPVVTYVQVVSVFLSAYTLVAMGVDRYIAVVHPFIGRITPKQAALVITGIWVVSVSIPLPTLTQSRVISLSRENNTTGMCLEHWDDQTTRYIYSLFIMVLHYFGPLTLLTFSYARICYTVWIKNSTSTDKTSSNKFQLAPSKIKLIKMMITVVVFYALCWLPLHIITLVGDHDPSIYDNKHVPLLWIFSHWLAMSNSCYNPIIYLWMSPKFRTGLKLFVQACCWPRPRKYGSSVKKSEPALNEFRLRATRGRCAAQALGRPQPASLRRTVAKWPG